MFRPLPSKVFRVSDNEDLFHFKCHNFLLFLVICSLLRKIWQCIGPYNDYFLQWPYLTPLIRNQYFSSQSYLWIIVTHLPFRLKSTPTRSLKMLKVLINSRTEERFERWISQLTLISESNQFLILFSSIFHHYSNIFHLVNTVLIGATNWRGQNNPN